VCVLQSERQFSAALRRSLQRWNRAAVIQLVPENDGVKLNVVRRNAAAETAP